MKNTLIKINIIKLSLFISAGVFISLYFPSTTLAKEIDSDSVIELINASRIKNNLNPLILSADLSKVAKSKAADMSQNHYFSHTSPEGKTPWHWFNVNHYSYKYAGENLAINYTDAQEEHDAWMKSPTHKKNILSSNFTEIGIATTTGVIDGEKSKIIVTVFGMPEKNILVTANSSSLTGKNSYILGAHSTKNDSIVAKTNESTTLGNLNNTLSELVKKQSPNVVWTIALIAVLIIIKDIVIKTIQTKNFHHKHSMINLILFIMIYITLF